MCESEYAQFKDHIESQIAALNQSISQYPSKGLNDRSAAYSQISHSFDDISRDLSELQATGELKFQLSFVKPAQSFPRFDINSLPRLLKRTEKSCS
jgi:hypothetical protein